MTRSKFFALLPVLLVWASAVLAAPAIELYRARYRPAAELVPIAKSALGAGGEVTLDARTATLVLNGSPEAVSRALALLERVDHPLRQVVIETDVLRVDDFDAWAVRVAWRTSLGPVSIGTLPLDAGGLSLGVDATRGSETTRSTSRLRLVEGATGIVRTGKALPVIFEPYWGTTSFVAVDTGFEAKVSVLEDDQVYLELRPFAGRAEDNGELTYIAVATSVTVSPGESVVIAETSRTADAADADLTGIRRDASRQQEVVLLKVELDR